MSPPALILGSSSDMLSKARRELAKLREEVNIDTVFNYFVSAHHVTTYLAAEGQDISALLKDPDLIACQAICNQGKHLRVDRNAGPVGEAPSGRSGIVGIGVVGQMIVGQGLVWDLTYDGISHDPEALARRVVAKLEAFFATHGIPTGL